MQLDLSARRRRCRWWLVPLAAVLLWAGLPRLAALWPAASAALSRVVGAHYTAQLDALQKENFTLHQRLAQSADALAENASLRQLAGCRRTVSAVTPARVIARTPDGLTLACADTTVGAAVLDPSGRWAGTVSAVEADRCAVDFPPDAALCGAYAGLVQPGSWQLTGLPADSALAAGDIVTTPGGDWIGTLAAPPTPDTAGLTAQAPLADTADLTAAVYFVKK